MTRRDRPAIDARRPSVPSAIPSTDVEPLDAVDSISTGVARPESAKGVAESTATRPSQSLRACHPDRTAARTWVVRCIGVLLACGFAATWGADPPSSALRRVFVPIDQLSKHVGAGWRPLSVDDFEQRLARQAPAAPAQLARAEYAAAWDAGALAGPLTLAVQGSDDAPSRLRLDPCELVIRDLKWTGGAAAHWGWAPDSQQTELLVEKSGELTGAWELAGQTTDRGTLFDFRGLPAVVTRLTLTLPDGWRIVPATPEAVVRETADGPARRWTLDLGTRPQCRFLVTPLPADPSRPALLYTETLLYSVRQEALRIQADYNVEVIGAPVSRLEFRIPPDVQVYSAQFGTDAPLAWQPCEIAGQPGVAVTLPEPLAGPLRPIRLRAIAPSKLEQDWSLPPLHLAAGVLTTGQWTVQVPAPLELRFTEGTGMRMIEADVGRTDSESYTYRLFRTDDFLQIVVGDPATRLAARVFTDVASGAEHWTSKTQIDFSARAGNAFIVRVRIPAGWDVADVRVDEPTAAGDLVGWDVEGGDGAPRILWLEFLEPVSVERPKRVTIDGRRLPIPPDQPVQVPAWQPLGVEFLEMLLAIAADASVRPVLEPGTPFQLVKPDDVPAAWRDTDFWKERLARLAATSLLLKLSDLTVEGNLYLQSRQTPVNATSTLRAEVAADRLRETLDLQIVPQHGRLDRVLVYFSEAGLPWNWELSDESATPLTAARLPAAGAASWDLPAFGELWEVRLPAPQGQPFFLRATRARNLPNTGRLPLAFVPQAIAFRGQVEAHVAAGMDLHWDAAGLETRAAAPDSNDPAAATRRQTWAYARPSDRLEFQAADRADERPAVIDRLTLFAAATLAAGDDVVHARAELGDLFPARELTWQLPADVVLDRVSADGRDLAPSAAGDGRWTVRFGAAAPAVVEIRYRRPHGARFGPRSRPVVVPQFEIPVLDAHVHLAIPQEARLGAVSGGPPLEAPRRMDHWRTRLFGPLGRPPSQPRFLPWDRATWPSLTTQSEPGGPSPAHLPADFPIPGRGWTWWSGAAPLLPARLECEVWSELEFRALQWSVLTVILALGLTLRVLRMPRRAELGIAWLALCLGLALSLPPVWGDLAGAAFVGALLGLVLPRRVAREPITARRLSLVPAGSTMSYPQAPALGLFFLALLVLWGGPAHSQTPRAEAARPAARRPVVVIPLDDAGQPVRGAALVYLSPDAWETLQQEPPPPATDAVFLTAARFDAAQRDPGVLQVEAQVTLDLPARRAERRVRLPLQRVFLAGAESCRLDEAPCAIFATPDGTAYEIALLAESPATDAATPPSRVTKTLRLQFQAPIEATPLGSRAEFGVPPIPATTWSLATLDPQTRLTTRGTRGATHADAGLRRSHGAWGAGGEIRWLWSPTIPAAPADVRPAVAHSALVELHPGLAVWRTRSRFRSLPAQAAAVRFELPAEAVVREVKAPGLAASRTVVVEGRSQLTLEFFEPPAGETLVELTVLAPTVLQDDKILLPAPPRPADAVLEGPPGVAVGLNTPVEFQLAAVETGPAAAALPVETFLEAWGQAAARPQAAYRALGTAPIPLQLVPRIPVRTVRQTATGRLGVRQLEWELTATLETDNAAAFQHRLTVDPRLRITSVAVQEDGANRLLRWSRQGELLVLFLRDKTTGLQSVQLTGTMPLQVPQELDLPTIRFVKADVAESRLVLTQDPELACELVGADGLEPLPRDDDLPVRGRGLVVALLQLPADPPRLAVKISRNDPQLACRTLHLLQLRKSGWRLETHLAFRVLQGHGSQFQIRIPPEIAQFEVVADDVRQLQEQDADGAVRVVLSPNEAVRGEFTAIVRAPLNLPSDAAWRVPEITPLNAALQESLVLVTPAGALQPAEPRLSGLEKLSGPPAWEQELGLSATQSDDVDRYQSAARPWTFPAPRVAAASPGAELPLRLAESLVWLDPALGAAGQTRFVILPGDQDGLELQIPADTTLDAAWSDGRPAPVRPLAPGRLAVLLSTPQFGEVVTLFWRRPGPLSGRQVELPLPTAAGRPDASSQVAVRLAPGTLARWAGSGRESTPPLWTLTGLEARLALAEAQLDDGRQLTAALSADLPRLAAAAGPTQPPEAAERWARAQARVRELTLAPADLAPAAAWPTSASRGVAVPVVCRSDAPAVELWLVNATLLGGGGAVTLSLVLLAAGLSLVRARFARTLARHPVVAWSALAAGVWLFFQPSSAACLLLLPLSASLWTAWTQRHQPDVAHSAFIVES